MLAASVQNLVAPNFLVPGICVLLTKIKIKFQFVCGQIKVRLGPVCVN
jgi:hypothetical protein